MSEARNHHYLPRCYLREFSPNKTTGNNVFAVRLIGTKKIVNSRVPPYVPPKVCGLINVDNIGAERDRNTIIDVDTSAKDRGTIEDIFNTLETEYPSIVKSLHDYGRRNYNTYNNCKIDDGALIVAIKLITIITYSRLPELDVVPLIEDDYQKFQQLSKVLESVKEIIELLKQYSDEYDEEGFFDELDMSEINEFMEMKQMLDGLSKSPEFASFFRLLDDSLFKMAERVLKFTQFKDVLKDDLDFYLVGSSPELKFITCEHPFIIKDEIRGGFTFILTPDLALHYSSDSLEYQDVSSWVSLCNSTILNKAKKFLVSNDETLLNRYMAEWHQRVAKT